MDILLDWEQLVAAYELASGEVISNNTKCATVLGWAPQVVESMLRSSDGETRADYQRMKASIRDRQIGQRGASFYVPPAPSTAMDVDAVAAGTVGGKGGKHGKGAGGAEKKCSHCGKKGHLATECWQLVGRPEGPKGGKGREGKGGKKGGKAGGGADRPQKQCTYCGKKGHEESDCWAKKRGDKPGGAGPESGQPDAGAARQVSMGPASSSHDYSGFMCMAATLDVRAVERKGDKTFVLVDGGSDLHLAPASMANDQLTPTAVTARDVQKQPIPLAGEQVCPFVMTRDDDEPALGAAKFLLSDTVKEPLLSTGLLHDGGYDVVYSQQHGCFLGRGAGMSITFGDDYVRVPMSRRTNTYGLDVLMADTPAEAWELAEGFRVAPAELAGTPAPSRPVRGRENFSPNRTPEDQLQPLEPAGAEQPEHREADPGRVVRTPSPASRTRQPYDPGQVPLGPAAVLGPDSRQRALKARLRELGEAQYGSKEVLWARLQTAERRVAERRALEQAIQQRAQERMGGEAPEEARQAPGVPEPTEQERELHELTHTPWAAWCIPCLLGEGAEGPHFTTAPAPRTIPLVLLDHAYTGVAPENMTEEDQKEKDDLATTLLAVDRDSNAVVSFMVETRQADLFAAQLVTDFLMMLGHRTVELRTDNDQAAMALQRLVQTKRLEKSPEFKTVLSNGSIRDSQSMGAVESAVRWWRGKFRTLRYATQLHYRVHLGPDHVLWAWIVRHAGWLNFVYRVRANGLTAYHAVHGHAYGSEIVAFGECVLVKVPTSKTRQMAKKVGQGMRRHKGDSVWARGVWVGKHDSSYDNMVLVPHGLVRARTIRRLPKEARWDQGLLDQCVAQPRSIVRESLNRSEGLKPDDSGPQPPPAASSSSSSSSMSSPEGDENADEGMAPGRVVRTPSPASRTRGPDHPGHEDASPEADMLGRENFSPDSDMLAQENFYPEPEAKRRRQQELMTRAVAIDDSLDYTCLAELPHIAGKSGFDPEQVAAGKADGLKVLEHHGVFKPITRAEGKDLKRVDTTWVITQSRDMAAQGKVKCRITGRDYKWQSPGREDVYAPMSQPCTNRVVDYYSMKMDDDANDPMVVFEVDLSGAYYQTPQDEDLAVEPCEEWKAARRAAGLPDDMLWRLLKQLPGQRGAGNRFLEHVRLTFLERFDLQRFAALPNFYRRVDSTILIDTHMDDWFGTGKRSEAEPLLAGLRETFELQGTDCFQYGTFMHLQRTRVRSPLGTFIRPHEKYLDKVVDILGLKGANACATPHLAVERPAVDPPLEADAIFKYRSASMCLNYLGADRLDAMRDIRELTQHMVAPTEHDMRCLKHVTRYLMGTPDHGVWLPWPDVNGKPVGADTQSGQPDGVRGQPGEVRLETSVDSVWAADKHSRKSVVCFDIRADDCSLHGSVRQQSFVALSSGEAEYGGVHTASTESLLFKRLFEWLGFTVQWIVSTDSSAAKGISMRMGVGRIRHLDVRLLWTQQAVQYLQLNIRKIDGTKNRADLGTKKHSAKDHARLRALNSIVSQMDTPTQEAVKVWMVSDTGLATRVRELLHNIHETV